MESNCKVRVFNVHIPTSSGTDKRKEDTIKYLCRLAVRGQGDAPHWVIGGDTNLSRSMFTKHMSSEIPWENRDGFTDTWVNRNGFTKQIQEAQKADFAFSRGIVLRHKKSWVGYASSPCVSDVHDMVVVMGVAAGTDRSSRRRMSPPRKLLKKRRKKMRT